MRNPVARGDLLFGPVNLFEHLQALLHPVVLAGIHQYGDTPTSLREDHGATGLLKLLYESGYPGPEFGQGADVFIYTNP